MTVFQIFCKPMPQIICEYLQIQSAQALVLAKQWKSYSLPLPLQREVLTAIKYVDAFFELGGRTIKFIEIVGGGGGCPCQLLRGVLEVVVAR